MSYANQKPCNADIGKPVPPDVFAGLMEQIGPFSADQRIAVAVSGGPDSMALCHLVKRWAEPQQISIVGLTVDHRLREEARREAAQVAQWLADIGMRHEVLVWQDGESIKYLDRSPQAAARDARYDLLTQWCLGNDVDYLLVAHHADDQAETFLARLIRGSGLDGLAAMQSTTTKNGVRVCRPLLPITKEDLVATCRAHRQDWVTDPSNDDDASTRVRLRKIMAAFDQEGLSRDRLLKTVEHMQRAKVAIDSAVADLMASAHRSEEAVAFQRSLLLDAPEEVGLRCLARCLMDISGATYAPRFDNLSALYAALKSEEWTNRTLHGCQIRLEGTEVVMSLELKKR